MTPEQAAQLTAEREANADERAAAAAIAEALMNNPAFRAQWEAGLKAFAAEVHAALVAELLKRS